MTVASGSSIPQDGPFSWFSHFIENFWSLFAIAAAFLLPPGGSNAVLDALSSCND
jgi:hypothetical protein